MATIQICDICGSSDRVKTERFVVGRERDASGNGYDSVEEEFDLCIEHRRMVYRYHYIKTTGDMCAKYAYNQDISNFIKGKIPK